MHGDAAVHRQHAFPSSSALVLQFLYEYYIFDALTVDELTAQKSCSNVVETGRSACI